MSLNNSDFAMSAHNMATPAAPRVASNHTATFPPASSAAGAPVEAPADPREASPFADMPDVESVESEEFSREFLEAERQRFAFARQGIRAMGLAIHTLTNSGLRKFCQFVFGDPLVRQVVIYPFYPISMVAPVIGKSYASLMAGAAQAAASHPGVRPHEQEALYAAALVANLPQWVHRYSDYCGTDDVLTSARRVNYFMDSALTGLHTSDPAQAAVVFRALGITLARHVNELQSDRLASMVRQAWRDAQAAAGFSPDEDDQCSSGPGYTTL